jgi:hypothetical protein
LRAIFISYRRSDTEGEAGRLFDDLVGRFSEQAVFMDVDAIQPGRDFRRAIEESVQACSVLLAMVGPTWLDVSDDRGGRRLEDESDYVRVEIATALRRDIAVVPVMVRGGKMPRAEQLPDDLRELAFRNGVELTHARWKSDLEILVRALKPYLDGVEERRGPVAAVVAPALDVEKVERVSRELAHYIGPIAEVVVKRAAKRCGSTGELCHAVAREIEAEGERREFLSRCPV